MKTSLKIRPDQFTTRPVNPATDLNFILHSWMSSYAGSHFAGPIDSKTYSLYHANLLRSILTDTTNTVTVICDPEDHDHILGYICHSVVAPLIHYIYVKFPYRKLGLGTHIFANYHQAMGHPKVLTHTHLPKQHKRLKKQLKSHLRLDYNPYIISAGVPREEES